MQREVTCASQPLVEFGAEFEAEAARVLARTEKRAQHDVVIVGRALAMDAVGTDVLEEVAMQFVDGKSQQAAVRVEDGQRQRGDEQRIQLERAVVALAGQVSAQMCDLRAEAVEDDLGGAVAESFETIAGGEAAPGVDPVLNAPAGDVGRIGRDWDLTNPGPHEALPCVLKARLAGLPKCPREVEAVVELHPFQPPLAIGRQRRAEPVGLRAKVERHALVAKPSTAHVLGNRPVAIRTLDDAEDRPRGNHARCSRPRSTTRSACECSTSRPSWSR